ncbi:TIGR02679 domain-containing protein [Frankia sp. Mgl5]|uniref:TIGR02679 domain-containing protein n=1 Tax=Frankia sp. Mgl5 TaxID=2933793 RepID=UPI0020101652|nr:TIGR02679 domain-containing protein [Frankia sp. Mgl5]MCK9928265.1 TIGR02679 domain-containing protein [Frankia sp. Mgl5]
MTSAQSPAQSSGRPSGRPSGRAAIIDALGGPALAPLWGAVHDRLSTGRPVTSVRVGPLGEDQQSALADLFGLDRLPGPRTTIRLDRLDALLTATFGVDTRAVAEALLGPIGDRAGSRAAAAHARSELWDWLTAHPVVVAEPALRPWAADARRAGLVDGSVDNTRALLGAALRVLAACPADGRPLPALADALLGRTHALDDGTRLSTLVLRGLAARYGVPAPTGAGERRMLWERAGVACDALSAQALVAGLRPTGDDALSRALRLWADVGQASIVTLAQLRACPGLRMARAGTARAGGEAGEAGAGREAEAGRGRGANGDAGTGTGTGTGTGAGEERGGAVTVGVVENPSVIAMAIGRFGARCPPLVCTSGWPSSAAVLLLHQLAQAGLRLRYHGDFDGDGLRIAAHVMARSGAVPWRMSTADYVAALPGAATPGSGTEDGRTARPGQVSEAPWDADLAQAVRAHNIAIYEERLVPILLADLAEPAEKAEKAGLAGRPG